MKRMGSASVEGEIGRKALERMPNWEGMLNALPITGSVGLRC